MSLLPTSKVAYFFFYYLLPPHLLYSILHDSTLQHLKSILRVYLFHLLFPIPELLGYMSKPPTVPT